MPGKTEFVQKITPFDTLTIFSALFYDGNACPMTHQKSASIFSRKIVLFSLAASLSSLFLFFGFFLFPSLITYNLPPTTHNPQPTTIFVPEPSDVMGQKSVAIPVSASVSPHDEESKRRLFDLTIEKDSFSVGQIVVYQDDIVTIRLTAGDKKYDFTIPAFGIKQKVEPGKSRIAEFQAVSPGEFEFVCTLCAGNVRGTLIIVPNGKNQSLTNKFSSL